MNSPPVERIARIELLLAQVEASPDAPTRAAARELVETLLAWHGAAIRVMAARVPEGELARLSRESEALESVLSLHDVRVPDAPRAKVSLPIAAQHRCDSCGAPVDGHHRHVLDPRTQRLACVCAACGREHLELDGRARELATFELSEAEWTALEVPVRLVFFTPHEDTAIARYPGPGGVVDARVPADAWRVLLAKSPELASLRPGADALLLHHIRGARDTFVVSIDECFRLAGILRTTWTGISGGGEKDAAVARFFSELRGRT